MKLLGQSPLRLTESGDENKAQGKRDNKSLTEIKMGVFSVARWLYLECVCVCNGEFRELWFKGLYLHILIFSILSRRFTVMLLRVNFSGYSDKQKESLARKPPGVGMNPPSGTPGSRGCNPGLLSPLHLPAQVSASRHCPCRLLGLLRGDQSKQR